jgi:predicted XRE-type DNA-binding protein
MPSFDSNSRFEDQSANENLIAEQDLLMEQILENINTTPIGQVLKKIATLPEVRKEKVLDLRQQLSKGKYSLNERLDVALDRVLEDLTT